MFRPMNKMEIKELKRLHKLAPTLPPWTKDAELKRRTRDVFILILWEDGVDRKEIQKTLNSSFQFVVVACKRAHKVRGTKPAYRSFQIPKPPAPYKVRSLNEKEKNVLLDIYTPGKRAPELLRDFINNICNTNNPHVTMAEVGKFLGISRERVRQISNGNLSD